MRIRSFACNGGPVPHVVEVSHDEITKTVFVEMRPTTTARRASGTVKRSIPRSTGDLAYAFFYMIVRRLKNLEPSTTKPTPRGSDFG